MSLLHGDDQQVKQNSQDQNIEVEVEVELEAGPRAGRPNFLTTVRFDDFDLPHEILSGLDSAGFEYATPIQAQAIPVALKGYDIAGQAQTGTGKTTAFLVPLISRLMKNKALAPDLPRAIVMTPTRELAMQIHEDAQVLCKDTGLRTLLVIGGMEYKEQASALESNPEIVICTPGRIIDYLQQGIFKPNAVEVAVVDEADRLLDMGFIKDLKYLLGKLPSFTQRQTMLFSATLDDRVLELTYEFMNPPQFITAEPDNSDKASIEQELYHVGRDEKLPLLLGLLRREEHQRVIIFRNTKSGAEWLAKKLTLNGFQAEGITGDLPQNKRLKMMESFKENRLQILVATDVASRGIHVDDVSHVYNFDLPQDPENYVHRIGRTARAGKTGKAVSFGCEDYVFHLEAIENLLGEKIPVFWASEDSFHEDKAGEVAIKSKRGDRDRKSSDRRSSPRGDAPVVSRGPAKSSRPGGIFGLSPQSPALNETEDPRLVLTWADSYKDDETSDIAFAEGEDAGQRDGGTNRRNKRRRGRRGGYAAHQGIEDGASAQSSAPHSVSDNAAALDEPMAAPKAVEQDDKIVSIQSSKEPQTVSGEQKKLDIAKQKEGESKRSKPSTKAKKDPADVAVHEKKEKKEELTKPETEIVEGKKSAVKKSSTVKTASKAKQTAVSKSEAALDENAGAKKKAAAKKAVKSEESIKSAPKEKIGKIAELPTEKKTAGKSSKKTLKEPDVSEAAEDKKTASRKSNASLTSKKTSAAATQKSVKTAEPKEKDAKKIEPKKTVSPKKAVKGVDLKAADETTKKTAATKTSSAKSAAAKSSVSVKPSTTVKALKADEKKEEKTTSAKKTVTAKSKASAEEIDSKSDKPVKSTKKAAATVKSTAKKTSDDELKKTAAAKKTKSTVKKAES